MSKEKLLAALQQAFEDLIAVAQEVETAGGSKRGEEWGPREVVAHLAGWEVIATVHVPNVVASMPPLFAYADPTQQRVLNEALNEAFVTLTADYSLHSVCDLLRRAYQRDLAMLRQVDETFFQEGQYVSARTKAVISHCHEHSEKLLLSLASLFHEQGKAAEAEPFVKRALALCERDLGPQHPHTQSVRSIYEELLQEMPNHRL
jgi:hypothetical protein